MNALYSLYDALVAINVPSDKARAVVEAMEQDVSTVLATKSDLMLLRQTFESWRADLKRDLEDLRAEFKHEMQIMRTEFKRDIASLELKMTVRFGAMLFAGLGLLFAALKLT